MGRGIVSCLIFIQLVTSHLLISAIATNKDAEVKNKFPGKLHVLLSISTAEKDITTPITTLPTTNPANPTATNPTLNTTVSNPDLAAAANPVNPLLTPATTSTSPLSSSASWCIASPSASPIALQVALDYACGYGRANCAAIQSGGNCYNPNTVHDHASFAFNSYYQKNPIPNSCNFGGTAVPTNTDPSFGTCQYQSTSTSSSILNTTNSSGSRVYGAGPITPTSSDATLSCSIPYIHILMSLLSLTLAISIPRR